MTKIEKIKLLIADDEGQLSLRTADYLEEHGFDVKSVSSGAEARAMILDWRPRFILADLMLPEMNALSLIDFIRNERSLKDNEIQVIVTSGHNSRENVTTCLKQGALDYIVKPFSYETLLNRLVFHCRKIRFIKELNGKELSRVDEVSLNLHLIDLLLQQAVSGDDLQEKLFNLTRMVAKKMDGVRCSVIVYESENRGHVLVSNDDRKATGIQLDLSKYPEVLNAIHHKRLVAIEDIESDRELKSIKRFFKNVSFNSMVVCPIRYRQDEVFGVLSVRMPASKKQVSDNDIRFVEIASMVISLLMQSQDFQEMVQASTNGFVRRSA